MPKFTVQRSVVIDKPVSEVFSKVARYEHMNQWSPWLVMERSAKTESRGTEGEVGAVHYWKGEVIGEGEMELSQVEINKTIEAELRFLAPWKSQATTQFSFAEDGNSTTVTWTMQGSLPFFMFWMKGMMEAWIGMDYERGLRMLKEYCETGDILSSVDITGEAEGQSFHYVGIKNTCSKDEIGPAMQSHFHQLAGYLRDNQLPDSALAFSIYHKSDMKKGQFTYTSGLGVPAPIENPPEGFVSGTLQGGKALTITHTGAYHHLGNAWSTGYSYLMNKKIKQRKKAEPLEVYVSDPTTTEVKDLKTVLYFPLR